MMQRKMFSVRICYRARHKRRARTLLRLAFFAAVFAHFTSKVSHEAHSPRNFAGWERHSVSQPACLRKASDA